MIYNEIQVKIIFIKTIQPNQAFLFCYSNYEIYWEFCKIEIAKLKKIEIYSNFEIYHSLNLQDDPEKMG